MDDMTDITHLALRADEMAIVIDALEADLEDYAEAAREAADEGDGNEAEELTDAAQRVRAVLQKVRGASND